MVEIIDRLLEFLARVHDKRPVLRDWLSQRFACNQQGARGLTARRGVGLQRDAIAPPLARMAMRWRGTSVALPAASTTLTLPQLQAGWGGGGGDGAVHAG